MTWEMVASIPCAVQMLGKKLGANPDLGKGKDVSPFCQIPCKLCSLQHLYSATVLFVRLTELKAVVSCSFILLLST